MKILQTQTLRGPNYWSVSCSKLIVVLLDLEGLDDSPSNTIPRFYDSLIEIVPSLKEKLCSLEYQRASLNGELRSSMMGHIFKHVALELQTLADMPVVFGCTCETASPGTYQVAIEYQNEAAGRYATRAALRLCQSIVETDTYLQSELQIDLEDLRELRAEAAQGASTDALVQVAEKRGIPWMHLETCDLFQFGYGKYQKRVQAALTSHSNVLGVELACDKERTKEILTRMGAPVPLGKVVYAFQELEDAIDDLGGYPIVIKPLDGNQGRGITIDIRSWRQAEVAYDRARDISNGVIVEHFYQGRDHRILVVNHKVVAVAERVPAHVVGNGQETIFALVDQENQDVQRGEGHDKALTQIKLDAATDEMLSRQGFTLNTILQPDQICYLRANANLSTGGIAIDRTDEIHPDTVWLAERASRIIDLDIVGIDVITTDITKPLQEVEGVIVEVNAAPGLRMHMAPSQGLARNVAVPILDLLFPTGTPTQIPVVAVAQARGTETPTPLINHIFSQVHNAVGCTTPEGAYIGNHLVKKGNATDAQCAQLILQDPMVDIAVLETSRSSILRSGLAFQSCDVGLVLNVVADQGAGNICSLDHQAKAHAVIAGAVHAGGYAVLNADDPRVAAMAEQVRGTIAYFSMDPENSLVRSHLQQGGIAAVYEQGYLSILQQNGVQRIEKVAYLPLTVRGRSPSTIAYALGASLVAYVQGVTVEQIRAALHTYRTSDQQPLEPMDWFNLDGHNQSGLLKPYLDLKDVPTKPDEERLPQLEPLSQPCCDRNRTAMAFKKPYQEPQPFCVGPLNSPFSGILSPSAPSGATTLGKFLDLKLVGQRQETNTESSITTSVNGEKGLHLQEPEPVITYKSPHHPSGPNAGLLSVTQNDPTKLWVAYENCLKVQTVLQNLTPQVSAVAVAPEITTNVSAPTVLDKFDCSAATKTEHKQEVAYTMRTQVETVQLVTAAEEMVERVHQKLTAFAQSVKQYGFKVWAVDQGTQISHWVKKQAPVAKQVAVNAAQKVAKQVLEKGMIMGAIAFVLGRFAAKVALEKGKELVMIAWEEFGMSAKSVNPTTLDPALKDVIALLGKDGRFEGEVFIFQQTNEGIAVHLKNGTPVYRDGQSNPHVKDHFIRRLGQLPKRVARVKADISQRLTNQDCQRQLIEEV